jgi:hypothetical protein
VAPVAPVPASAPSVSEPAAAAAASTDTADGWRRILQSLRPQMKGIFIDARPLVEGSRLVLSFRYGFHYDRATASKDLIEPLVRAWLGESATIEMRLQDTTPPGGQPASRPMAPEEHPVIKAAERALEARVVRVRPAAAKETT